MTPPNDHDTLQEHIDLYGMTTATAAARVVYGCDHRRALAGLESLVRDGRLFRYGKVYSPKPTPPKPRDRWHDLAILSYCCLGNRPRPRIPSERLAAALDGPAKKLSQRSPANKPCIFDRHDRLARLWVEPYTDDPDGAPLGDVLAILQRSARGRAFQVWAYLALSGDFTILVLCRGRARADELERWLARAPLVGQAGPETVEVPVSTAAIQ
jgi:hypothetical protein